jgi:hypothetical protein
LDKDWVFARANQSKINAGKAIVGLHARLFFGPSLASDPAM